MAGKIKETFPDAEVELIKGSKGVFIVKSDGKELWNKAKMGDFPDEKKLVSTMKGS